MKIRGKENKLRHIKTSDSQITNIHSTIYKRVTNKDLLYSTRNYIPYPVINHNGKEYKKKRMYIYICITESLCYTAEVNTTL